ncbi:Uncharacterised protein [Acinetobacter baumannii]|nr:Uncharacterised protein [Acinetobacter baumannii]SSS42719.1 Uncharacterised protein [Acinetobacter baumannii]SST05863.1 Uncharacterised protein [Acinetobacter baumannii]
MDLQRYRHLKQKLEQIKYWLDGDHPIGSRTHHIQPEFH